MSSIGTLIDKQQGLQKSQNFLIKIEQVRKTIRSELINEKKRDKFLQSVYQYVWTKKGLLGLQNYNNMTLQVRKRSVREAINSKKPSQTIKIIENRYEIKNVFLGEGSFGQVYACWDRVDFQVLAIKAISKEKILDRINRSTSRDKTKEFYVKSLRDQAQLMEKIQHPNILRFYGYSESPSYLYFLLEYCNEGSLQALIDKEIRLPVSKAIPLMRQILSAVALIHRNSICHRDIKPQNILLHNGLAKLCDFGFAVNMRDQNKSTAAFTAGTEQFLAPECIQDNSFNLKSDIWSLGVTFFKMLNGRSPWESSKTDRKKLDHLKSANSLVYQPQVPFSIRTAINKMLTFDDYLRPTAFQLQHFFQE